MSEPKMLHPKLAKIRKEQGFYRHQVEGVNRLCQQQNFILADEMGLGKSLQSLAVAAIDFERGVAGRILIVCLASLKYNWLEEIEERTHFRAMVLEGTPDKRRKQMQEFSTEGYEILIVNYEQVVKHVEEFNEMMFDIVIMDEAHSIKTPTAKRTKACMGLVATRFFALTGSPMLNRPDELWTLLHRVAPDKFPRYWPFRMRYCQLGGWQGKQVVGVKYKDELVEKISPIMLRRTKAEVLPWLPQKLPVKQEWLDLTPLQRKMYKQADEELKITFEDLSTMEINSALTLFLRHKQICATSHCLDEETDESSKLDRLEEIVEELCVENGEKLVVFTQFRPALKAARDRIRKKVPTWTLHGDIPLADRQAYINAWTNLDGPGVLVCMLQVAGVGLNLTAASTVVFVDKLYVPKLNEQAVDRLHRIGQERPVQTIELLTRGTIERRIERLLKRKDVMFGEVIGATEETSFKRKLIEAMMAKDDD